jgi:hypothetical protein
VASAGREHEDEWGNELSKVSFHVLSKGGLLGL